MSVLETFERRLPGYLAELRELVEIETPTGNVVQAGLAAGWLADRLSPFGEIELEHIAGYTVWPVGSWAEPWREVGGSVFGPGAYDMKGGLLFVVELLRWLDATGADHPTLDIVINPDEEIGSLASAKRIREIATENDLALVLEPSTADGIARAPASTG